jgi:hypothetical protein
VQKTSLYRHFNGEGRLLYVGISCNLAARTNMHCLYSYWFGEVARIDVEHHPNRPRAERAEAIAIRDENPLYNRDKPEIPDLASIEEWEEDGAWIAELSA